jgi:hypothetical protein
MPGLYGNGAAMNAKVDELQLVRDGAAAGFAATGLCGTPTPPPKGPVPPLPASGTLSDAHYQGGFDPREYDAVDGAQSQYSGTVFAASLDRQLVSAVLPPLVRLAAPIDPVRLRHPVLLMFGLQDEPRGLVGGVPQVIPSARPYYELILLVPFVVRLGKNRWHSYSARMYLDYLPPIEIGNGFYAYSKALGEFEAFGTVTETRCEGNTVFETDISTSGAWLNAAQAQAQWPSFAYVQRLLEMPIVGHNSLLGYVHSYFEWDYGNAQIAAASSTFRFCQEFRAGMQPWVDLNLLAAASDAAFSVRNVRWRLSTRRPRKAF